MWAHEQNGKYVQLVLLYKRIPEHMGKTFYHKLVYVNNQIIKDFKLTKEYLFVDSNLINVSYFKFGI